MLIDLIKENVFGTAVAIMKLGTGCLSSLNHQVVFKY